MSQLWVEQLAPLCAAQLQSPVASTAPSAADVSQTPPVIATATGEDSPAREVQPIGDKLKDLLRHCEPNLEHVAAAARDAATSGPSALNRALARCVQLFSLTYTIAAASSGDVATKTVRRALRDAVDEVVPSLLISRQVAPRDVAWVLSPLFEAPTSPGARALELAISSGVDSPLQRLLNELRDAGIDPLPAGLSARYQRSLDGAADIDEANGRPTSVAVPTTASTINDDDVAATTPCATSSRGVSPPSAEFSVGPLSMLQSAAAVAAAVGGRRRRGSVIAPLPPPPADLVGAIMTCNTNSQSVLTATASQRGAPAAGFASSQPQWGAGCSPEASSGCSPSMRPTEGHIVFPSRPWDAPPQQPVTARGGGGSAVNGSQAAPAAATGTSGGNGGGLMLQRRRSSQLIQQQQQHQRHLQHLQSTLQQQQQQQHGADGTKWALGRTALDDATNAPVRAPRELVPQTPSPHKRATGRVRPAPHYHQHHHGSSQVSSQHSELSNPVPLFSAPRLEDDEGSRGLHNPIGRADDDELLVNKRARMEGSADPELQRLLDSPSTGHLFRQYTMSSSSFGAPSAAGGGRGCVPPSPDRPGTSGTFDDVIA